MATHVSRQPIANVNLSRKGNTGFSFDLPGDVTAGLELPRLRITAPPGSGTTDVSMRAPDCDMFLMRAGAEPASQYRVAATNKWLR